MRETCFFCKHADFKTQLDTPMHAFAKCAKARNEMEKATYYPRTQPCATGAFRAASEAAMRKRRQEFGEPPSDSNPTERK
nr:hypothetical protein [Neisseria polysaccharea]